MTSAARPRADEAFQVFGRLESESASGAPHARACAWPGCADEGAHRAPKSRTRIDEFQWFCLEHVRIYNSAWNYYLGMSEAEVESCIRSDTTWNRPTWPLSGQGGAGQGGGADCGPEAASTRFENLRDPFGLFTDRGRAAPAPPQLSAPERRAFSVLGLGFPASFEEVKARYRVLVKRHHPDANGGAKDAEERLKRINEAFETLKNGLFA